MRFKVNPCDGGGGDRIGRAREWGLASVIENVEAPDAVVEVVMGEELGKVHGLVLHCDARLVLCCTGNCTRRECTDLPCRWPYTLHYPVAEVEGMLQAMKH